MKILKSKEQFKNFYREKEIVSIYDTERSRTMRKRIVRRLERYVATKEVHTVDKIFEGGVGTGFITEELLKRGKVYGIDTSDEMINAISNRIENPANLILQKGSIFEINLDKNNFDVAISIRVLMHLTTIDVSKALRQLSLVTRSGGRVIFDLPANSLSKRLIQYVKKYFSKRESEVQNYMYSEREINKIIREEKSLSIEYIYAVDHLSVLSPLYLLSYVLNSRRYENFIYNLELRLLNFKIFNTQWFIICRKTNV